MRNDHFEEDGEIISRKTIEKSIDEKTAETYRIILDNKKIGGVVIKIDKEQKKGELVLLFVNPENHSKGVGYGAWMTIEKCIQKLKSGKQPRLILKKEIYIFMLISVDFTLLNFIINSILILISTMKKMMEKVKIKKRMTRIVGKCSYFKK
jgi:hypothetical protein